jgi:hypothetical protein
MAARGSASPSQLSQARRLRAVRRRWRTIGGPGSPRRLFLGLASRPGFFFPSRLSQFVRLSAAFKRGGNTLVSRAPRGSASLPLCNAFGVRAFSRVGYPGCAASPRPWAVEGNAFGVKRRSVEVPKSRPPACTHSQTLTRTSRLGHDGSKPPGGSLSSQYIRGPSSHVVISGKPANAEVHAHWILGRWRSLSAPHTGPASATRRLGSGDAGCKQLDKHGRFSPLSSQHAAGESRLGGRLTPAAPVRISGFFLDPPSCRPRSESSRCACRQA